MDSFHDEFTKRWGVDVSREHPSVWDESLTMEDRLIRASDSLILHMTSTVQQECFTVEPDAYLAFSHDKRGRVTHLGIYVLHLLLNEKGNFDASKQYAPQLLGERFAVNTIHGCQLLKLFAWLSATSVAIAQHKAKESLRERLPLYRRMETKLQ